MNFNKITKTDIICREVSNKVKGVSLNQYSISCYASLNSRSFSRSQRIHDGLGMNITLSNGLTIFTGKFAGWAIQPKQFLSGIQEAPADIIKTFQSEIKLVKECLSEVSEDIRVNGYSHYNLVDIAEKCFSNDDASCYVDVSLDELFIALRNRFKYCTSLKAKNGADYYAILEAKNGPVSLFKSEHIADAIKDFANSIDEEALIIIKTAHL